MTQDTQSIDVTMCGSSVRFSWHDSQADKLDQILSVLSILQQKVDFMSGTIEDLTTRVAANTTVIGSAIDLLHGLKAKLDAAGTDPAALAALSAELGAKDQELADAIVQSTPAQNPTPEPTPV